MKRHTGFAAVTALLALSACITIEEPHPLADTEWQLVAIDTSGSTTTLTPGLQRRHTLTFLHGGDLQLQLDCNRGRATWLAEDPASGAGSINIWPITATKALCPEPSFGDVLITGLPEAERFTTTIDGRQLVLESDTLRFTFAAAE